MANYQTSDSRGKILIIDDTPDNLRLLSTMLESQGYQVKKAISGQFALQGVKVVNPDLILLDVNMPVMNGYEVCQELKKIPQIRDIPVIFISALDKVLDKVKGFTVGGVDYITKPFQLEEVLARVNSQINQQRLSQQIQQKNIQLQSEIAERRRAEEKISFLLSTTKAIGEAEDFHSALQVILCSCCRTINWDLGEAWIPNIENNVLECSRGWCFRSPGLEEFRNKSLTTTFAPGSGFVGRIWLSKKPEWIEDVSLESEEDFLRAKVAKIVGLKAGFGVPILVNDQVLAILVFFKQVASPPQKNLLELVNAVASQLSSLMQRKQAEAALRIAEYKYHSIVENAVEGIFQTTPSGQYLSANRALARLYGYDSPAELITTIQDISQIYVEPKRRQEFVAAMEVNDTISSFESQVYKQDGGLIWISENARAVRNTQGKLLYYEGTVADITERRLTQEALKFQKEQNDQLLLNILPKPIVERLQQGQTTIADHFEEVSVLFADIVGFTEFSSTKSPEALVEVLNVIFSQFDQLAEKYGLEKIKMIGDAYMVVGGLPTPLTNHAYIVAQMALDMQAKMVNFTNLTEKVFQLRIGINTGPVVAGVIGISKFSYDLWGDTVNIASRMETNGIPGEIQVTANTYELLKEYFVFQKRGQIPIKGKGSMTTYLLKGRH
ncbi:adenylate/guanylate cyclase domain-containing protein [Lyngbya aestuarii]|uniref:adenylate/guanylate cyclase domain-containing protein n=1 Tax=Lyngbya aestuarii TaxID=118322 RepID=UPI00403DCD12